MGRALEARTGSSTFWSPCLFRRAQLGLAAPSPDAQDCSGSAWRMPLNLPGLGCRFTELCAMHGEAVLSMDVW